MAQSSPKPSPPSVTPQRALETPQGHFFSLFFLCPLASFFSLFSSTLSVAHFHFIPASSSLPFSLDPFHLLWSSWSVHLFVAHPFGLLFTRPSRPFLTTHPYSPPPPRSAHPHALPRTAPRPVAPVAACRSSNAARRRGPLSGIVYAPSARGVAPSLDVVPLHRWLWPHSPSASLARAPLCSPSHSTALPIILRCDAPVHRAVVSCSRSRRIVHPLAYLTAQYILTFKTCSKHLPNFSLRSVMYVHIRAPRVRLELGPNSRSIASRLTSTLSALACHRAARARPEATSALA